jgi:hypothetical protein
VTVASSSAEHDAGGGMAGAGGATAPGTGGAASVGSANTSAFDPICLLPAASGGCDALFPSYWHDPQTGVCEPLDYGGCGGNANLFKSLEECQMACHGGTPDMDACSTPTGCVLLTADCCAPCGEPTTRSFVAVNRSSEVAYSTVHDCLAKNCPSCAGPVPPSRANFAATCRDGQCAVVDIRETSLASCSDLAGCRLRNGLACCESCAGSSWVALSAKADLTPLLCGKDPAACPPCVATPPDDLIATCGGDGRCFVNTLTR